MNSKKSGRARFTILILLISVFFLSDISKGFAGILQDVYTDSLSLEYCYNRIEQTYPLVDQLKMEEQISELNRRVIRTGNLPQLTVTGQVSYQSEIPEVDIPIPNAQSVTMSKDQYSVSLDIAQKIFDGGRIRKREDIADAQSRENRSETEIDLFVVRQQLNRVYFSILLSKRQMKNNNTLIEDLTEQLKKVRSQVENGVLLPGQKFILEAELLRIRQDSTTIMANIRAGYDMLGELINEEVSADRELVLPGINLSEYTISKKRPEYRLFDSKRTTIERMKEMEQTHIFPTLSAFGTTAWANPGLNIFDDSFNLHYLVGMRLQWNFWNAVNTGDNKAVLKIRQSKIEREEESFTRQMRTELDKIKRTIEALEMNLEKDKEIISLRKRVVEEQASKLENGVITSTEYITELNNLSRARLTLMLRQVQLSKQKIDYITTLGYKL
ncbi:MAG TPA: TolC family protein [Balneolaceae bacterium]|nr:TolC family protein [Balneolaceae bacterium]